MKAVITGAAGFIGSHLCERLLGENYKVIGIDCMTDYYPVKIKKENISKAKTNRNFTFIEANISNIDMKELLSDVDFVFHLAAQAGVRASWGRDFGLYTELNINATQCLLESVKENKNIKKIVFASSSSVYGDSKELPVKESTVTNPVSPYGVTKLAAEQLFHAYAKNYRIPFNILRFFTVYGPRQRPDMGFNIFISKILKGETIPIFDGGHSTRDFTYVDDIVNGCLLAAVSDVSGETFNLGGGHKISLLEVIKLIEKASGKKAVLRIKDAQKGDVSHTWSDISKAMRLIGYKPVFDIKKGLEKEVEWLKKEDRQNGKSR